MTPRLLVLDLDGTLLTRDKRVRQRDVAAAAALRRHGVEVSVATGRLFSGTAFAARALGVTGSVAVMNGSELVDTHSGAVRQGAYLGAPVGRSAREEARAHGLHAVLFRSGGLHYGASSAHHAPYLRDWSPEHTVHDDLHAAPAWEAEDVLSIGMIGGTGPVARVRRAIERWLPGHVQLTEFDTHQGERFLSLHHAGVDKGTAVRRLAEERGLAPEQAVVVGDWLNDVPMFRAAGRSFCMGGAMDEVSAEAHEVLRVRRDEGGAVAEVAERVWGVRA